MNVMLYAFPLLIVLLKNCGLRKTILLIMICGIIQVVVAIPFLMVNPIGYLSRAFELVLSKFNFRQEYLHLNGLLIGNFYQNGYLLIEHGVHFYYCFILVVF